MKSKLNVIGIFLGLLILILGPAFSRSFGGSRNLSIALSAAGGAVFGASIALFIYFREMKKNKSLSREVKDERNRLIQEKAGHVTNWISFFTLFIVCALFLAMGYQIPAIVIFIMIIIQLITFLIVSAKLQKEL